MLDTLSATDWLLVSVTGLGALVVDTTWFPKDKLAGLGVTGNTPTPINGTVCGLLLAPSVTVKVPVRLFVAAGLKVMLIKQPAPPAPDRPLTVHCCSAPL